MRRGIDATPPSRLLAALDTVVQPIVEALTLRLHPRRDGPAALYIVYRRRNEAHVQSIIARPLERGWTVALWALDEVASSLADLTLGSGPGKKFELLNRLLDLQPNDRFETIVFSDDDYDLVRGDLPRFVAIMRLVGFDVAQPVHVSPVNAYHPITVRQRRALARRTGFVEIGPVFAFSSRIAVDTLPFPDDAGMGWGLEFAWAHLAEHGCRLGTIDAAALHHTVRPGAFYDEADAWWEMVARLERAGIPLTDWRGETTARWSAYWPFAPRGWKT